MEFRHDYDAYVWCASERPSIKALVSFAVQGAPLYEHCVKIANVDEFARIMTSEHDGMNAHEAVCRPVLYGSIEIDLNEDGPPPIDRLFMKPWEQDGIRYADQNEIRVVFLPDAGEFPLELPPLKPFVSKAIAKLCAAVDITAMAASAKKALPYAMPRIVRAQQFASIRLAGPGVRFRDPR